MDTYDAQVSPMKPHTGRRRTSRPDATLIAAAKKRGTRTARELAYEVQAPFVEPTTAVIEPDPCCNGHNWIWVWRTRAGVVTMRRCGECGIYDP